MREIDALGGEGACRRSDLFAEQNAQSGQGACSPQSACADRPGTVSQSDEKNLEQQDNLFVKQAEIIDIRVEDGRVTGVVTKLGTVYPVQAAILCCGTYLNGLIHIGGVHYESGPDGCVPAKGLTESLQQLGIEMRRFKTGTPSRVHKRSIDFSRLERQQGDEEITPFSFETTGKLENKVDCYIGYTNDETHRVIRENLDRSPLYGGPDRGRRPPLLPQY